MKKILFIILLFPLTIYSQNNLKGRIVDQSNNKSISNATIFVNGTTIGTISDPNGYFILENITPPCNIGVSHIKYEPSILHVENSTSSNLTILLEPRNIQLKQVKVSNRNMRSNNVSIFKANFLGLDYYGEKAKLLNDKDLFFSNKYIKKKTKLPASMRILGKMEKKIIHEKDGNYFIHKKISNKTVTAKAPLMIDLPYLGYKIQTELIDFQINWSENNTQRCTFLGYYFFTPYKPELRKYIKRREKAYYNSRLHFGRALYKKDLKKNGFQLLEITGNKKLKTEKTKLISSDSFNTIISNHTLKIIGLKGKQFTVIYNSKSNGSPKDLNTHKLQSGPQSIIYFNSDTCRISSNGIISDNNIIFGGALSRKKVGSMLPEDYHPKK